MSARKPFQGRGPVIFILLAVLVLLAGRFSDLYQPVADLDPGAGDTSYQTDTYLSVAEAFRGRLKEVLVEGNGTVLTVLPDDNRGSRHQRLIIRVSPGQTILVAHNIDLAPRIPNVTRGDLIGFRGSYVFNDKGGIVHWTHHDPKGEHPDGWLLHNGTRYK